MTRNPWLILGLIVPCLAACETPVPEAGRIPSAAPARDGAGGVGPRHYLSDMAHAGTQQAAAPAARDQIGSGAGPAGGAQPPPPGYPSPAVCPPPPKPVGGGVGAAPSNALPAMPFPAAWQKVLTDLTTSGAVPGAVVIIKSPAWGVRVGTAGYADLATKAPMAPGLQFRVGSISKIFLAQTILQLEQEGRLRLTDPVIKYLGGDPVIAGIPHINDITVAQLLQMDSGITNYLGAPKIGYSPQVAPQKAFTPDQLMSVLSTANGETPLPPDFAPRATYPNPYWVTLFQSAPPAPAPYPFWYYSNSNYILLGMIAEQVSGLPADQVISRYVIDRLGLGDTYFARDDSRTPAMHGYTKWGSIPYPVQVYDDWCDVTALNPSYAWTAGAIVSTPWDLLKLSEAMFKTDALLNQGTKVKWYNFASADIHIGWQVMGYGMGGLMQPTRWYGMARGHGGAFPGYKSLLYYFFDEDTSFILATNTWDKDWEAVALDALMPLVSSAVTTPEPPNGAWGVVRQGSSAVVRWQAGRLYGSLYQVYAGTDATAVDAATMDNVPPGVVLTTAMTPVAVVSADAGRTLYWKVDTYRPGDPVPVIPGPLWSFTPQ